MKISYKWLCNYLRSDLTAEEMMSILTDIGLEVDGAETVETIKGGLAGVVVGKVLTCTDHPDSDHLHVTTVAAGDDEPLNIVCGAANVAAGQKVLVAKIGAVLYPSGSEEAFKIKKSKIRGVESFGMICAEDELGIGASHDGIMVLPAEATVGTPAAEYLGIESDIVIEIGLTPNRADAMSHYGVARDVAAYLHAHGRKAELVLPDVSVFSDKGLPAFDIEVECKEGAPRYAGILMRNIKIAPSPEWLQNDLRAIGINPKNNVVDITNFVLHELGQPLHAFDADRIAGNRIRVRTCEEGTCFTTLDGIERKLSCNDLMICDAEKPMCMAGVMGGRDSGVTDQTCSVFIESAYFNPVMIRKSARRHGISSDASFRYERGIDPNITIYALKRAVLLIQELAGGEVASGVTDMISDSAVTEPFRFEFSYDRLNRLVGQEIPRSDVDRILDALSVQVERRNGDVLSVAVPAYRVDVRREADLVEDVLRIYGYNNIAMPANVRSCMAHEERNGKERIVDTVAQYLADNGFTEIMSNSLTKAAYYEHSESFPLANCVKIMNPLSADLNVMRQTLLFNSLEAVALNTNHRNPNLKLFELGNVYRYNPERAADGGLAPYGESYRLAVTMTGLDRLASWNAKAEPADFYRLRAVAEHILGRFGLDIYKLQSREASGDVFREGMTVLMNGKELLSIGIVADKLLKPFDIKTDVFYLEMDFGLFTKAVRKHNVKAEELPRFPAVRRDLALLVDRNVTYAQLRAIAFSTERKLLRNVTLFDVYEGDKVPAGKKSYALGFVLQDMERTLTDQAIDKVMTNLLAQFSRQTGAVVRE